MPEIQLPLGMKGIFKVPKSNEALVNVFNNLEGQILPRDGIVLLSTLAGGARGSFKWNDSLYAVFGTTLYKVTNVVTGATSAIGTITGSGDIQTAIGFNDAVIVDPGGDIFTLDTADTLTDISGNANFQPCVDVAHINGRFVYIPSNGDPAFFSDVGAAGTVQATSFFDAEELPDRNNGVFNFGNTLYICGEQSIELFRDVGTSPVPFQRVQGATLRWGYIGGLLEYTDTFLFVGRERSQDYGIYAIQSGRALKISNAWIDNVLRDHTALQRSQTVPGRVKFRGYDVATFTLANDSYGFYKGNWFRLDTVDNGESKPWRGGFITELDGHYYTASETELGIFDQVDEDFGSSITRQIDIGFQHPDNEWFSAQKLQLVISQGFNSAKRTVGLFTSQDNVLYGPGLFKELGELGEYEMKLDWNPVGGLGSYDGFMGLRIYTTQDLVFATNGAFLDVRP